MPEINHEFVERVVGKPIASFVVGEGAKPGDNVAGSLKSVKATLKNGEILHLVCKFLPEGNPELVNFARDFKFFLAESTVYGYLCPKIITLMETKGYENYSLPVPGFFAANAEEDEFLCLEDVRPQGFQMADKYKGLTLEETVLALTELGKFHASTYYFLKYGGERLTKDHPGMDSMFNFSKRMESNPMDFLVGKTMFAVSMEGTVDALKHLGLHDEASRVSSKFLQDPDTTFHLMQERMKLTDRRAFACIIHGDFWSNNILFKYDTNTKLPSAIKFLDFQMTRVGNVFEDLLYFMYTSTTPEFRKKHLVHVLNEYYEAFEATLNAINYPMPLHFTRGSLIDMFYEHRLGMYGYLGFAIPLQLADPVTKEMEEEEKKKLGLDKMPPPNFSEMTPDQMAKMISEGVRFRQTLQCKQVLKKELALSRIRDITKEFIELKLL